MIPTLQKKRHLKTPPSADSMLNSGAQLHLQASEEAAEPAYHAALSPALKDQLYSSHSNHCAAGHPLQTSLDLCNTFWVLQESEGV